MLDQQAAKPLNRLLRLAVLAGVETAVRLHVKRGDDLDARDGGGMTPLMLAASKNKGLICSLLISSGADTTLTDPSGRDALAIARDTGAREVVSVLEALLQKTNEGIFDANEAAPENARLTDLGGEPESAEDGEDSFDLSEWEAEEDGPAPEADETLVEAASAVHRIISDHRPIDTFKDWGDFETFLPERAAPLPKAGDEEGRKGIRRLLLRALREGSVPERDVVVLVENDDGSRNEEGEAILLTVLGDMGAETDERLETGEFYSAYEESDAEDEQVSAALAFMEDAGSSREPMRLYFRDMRGSRLLTADEEVSLGRQMEEAAEEALDALASWPEGVIMVLAAASRVRSGEIGAESVSEGGPDEPTEDGGVAETAFSGDEEAEECFEGGVVLSQADREFLGRAAVVRNLAEQAGTGGAGENSLRDALASARLSRPFLAELALTAGEDSCEAAVRFGRAVSLYAKARERMIVSNLRLSVSIVKRYQGLGLALDDLVQEGNVGLMKAVDRYDWRRGFRFSTYATWWIRQQASRAVADQGKTIRVPVHVQDTMLRISREAADMERLNGRPSSAETLAVRLGMPVRKVAGLMARMEEPVPLHESDVSGKAVADMLIDASVEDPSASVERADLAAVLERMLADLDPRAAEVLTLRYGLDGNAPRTLEETGEHFGVTRERARQIEASALKKLAHPVRVEILVDFLEGAAARKPRKRDAQPVGQVAAESVNKVDDDGIDRVLARARADGANVVDGRASGGEVVIRMLWNGPQTRWLIRTLLDVGFRPCPGMEYRK